MQSHDEVTRPVVGQLHRVDLDAVAGDPHDAVPAGAARAARRTARTGQVEALGLGDDLGQPGTVRAAG